MGKRWLVLVSGLVSVGCAGPRLAVSAMSNAPAAAVVADLPRDATNPARMEAVQIPSAGVEERGHLWPCNSDEVVFARDVADLSVIGSA